MRPRWRVVIPLFSFLLIGAAVNVGTAWFMSSRVDNPDALSSSTGNPSDYDDTWPFPVPESLGGLGPSERYDRLGCTVWLVRDSRADQYPLSNVYTLVGRRIGFPFHCLEAWDETRRSPERVVRRHNVIRRNQVDLTEQEFPVAPRWPGFIANTLVYAATLAALWFIPRYIIARARRRRNHCPTPGCNYPLDGLKPGTPCPECGKIASRS